MNSVSSSVTLPCSRLSVNSPGKHARNFRARLRAVAVPWAAPKVAWEWAEAHPPAWALDQWVPGRQLLPQAPPVVDTVASAVRTSPASVTTPRTSLMHLTIPIPRASLHPPQTLSKSTMRRRLPPRLHPPQPLPKPINLKKARKTRKVKPKTPMIQNQMTMTVMIQTMITLMTLRTARTARERQRETRRSRSLARPLKLAARSLLPDRLKHRHRPHLRSKQWLRCSNSRWRPPRATMSLTFYQAHQRALQPSLPQLPAASLSCSLRQRNQLPNSNHPKLLTATCSEV